MSSAEVPPFTVTPPAEFDIPSTNIHARLFQEGDADDLARLASEESVQRYVPWAKRIHDAGSASNAIHEFQTAWDRKVMARYCLEDNGRFMGYAGIWSDQNPDYYEFGFAMLPEFRGQGNGTKVVTELLKIAKEKLGAKGMVAYVDDTNEASKAVVIKHEFRPSDEFDSGDRRYELSF